MKHFNLIKTLIFSVIFFSLTACQDPPIASFSVTTDTVYIGYPVLFLNTSSNAEKYVWDFGDGETSTDDSPIHYYTNSGNYLVTLTASNKFNKENIATSGLYVMQTTDLECIVRSFKNDERIDSCLIKLYTNYFDYAYDRNSVYEGYTDENGKLKFRNLNQTNYYFTAHKDIHQSLDYEIKELIPNEVNYFNITLY